MNATPILTQEHLLCYMLRVLFDFCTTSLFSDLQHQTAVAQITHISCHVCRKPIDVSSIDTLPRATSHGNIRIRANNVETKYSMMKPQMDLWALSQHKLELVI